MLHWEVELALNALRDEQRKWKLAYQDMRREADKILNRLIHEGIANWMSVEQIATAIDMTPKQVRLHMRRHGLEPKNGRSALAHAAAEALRTNADLLGVDPLDMDLTSPLAYLPMGSDLRKKLQSEAVQGVKDVD
jgi:DNA-binding transcriptional ArsR family regulator